MSMAMDEYCIISLYIYYFFFELNHQSCVTIFSFFLHFAGCVWCAMGFAKEKKNTIVSISSHILWCKTDNVFCVCVIYAHSFCYTFFSVCCCCPVQCITIFSFLSSLIQYSVYGTIHTKSVQYSTVPYGKPYKLIF